jgi:hypothetical protein
MQNSNVMALGTNSYVGMPQYWITAPKLENAWGDNANYNPVAFTVQATIYAQEGSWFVIPVTLNPAVTPLDGTAVESNIASAATTRMRRLNYRVQVVGNIVQNMTPTGMEDYNANPANGDGITRGAMAQWMDSMAYPTAFGPDEGRNNYRGQSWMTVHYEADPVDISVNTGLYLPVSPDLLYVG